MKRIDDKIKEIEKKDKTNRWLFYGFIVLIIGFLFYASTTQKKISEQKGTISKQEETLAKQNDSLIKSNIALTKTKDSLLDTRKSLKMSMTESEFWNETLKIYDETGKVSPFFDYITYGADITRKPENIKEAFNRISNEGSKGYVYAGHKSNDSTMSNDKVIKVLYRSDGSHFNFESKPKIGDIVQLTINSRKLYSSATKTTQNPKPNPIGTWQIGLPAYVMEVIEQTGDVVILKLSYFKL